MKIDKIVEMANKLNVKPSELAVDLNAINLLSDNFKNMLNSVLLSAGITIENNLESFDTENKEMLKLFNCDEILNSFKQQTLIESEFIGFIHEFLDYPVIEK